MTVILGLLTLALLPLLPRLWLASLERRLRYVCAAQRVIVLAFHDGPSRAVTPRVLARLEATGVAATFFVLGRNVAHNEHLLDEMIDRGHQLGSHGEQHVHHYRSWPWTGILDLRASDRRLRSASGCRPRKTPFQPPFGRLNPLSWIYVLATGRPLAVWTHDSFDTMPDCEVPPALFADTVRATGGGVVRLHDCQRALQEADDDDDRVLAKLDAVLELASEGYRFLRYDQLLDLLRGGMPPPIRPRSQRRQHDQNTKRGHGTAARPARRA